MELKSGFLLEFIPVKVGAGMTIKGKRKGMTKVFLGW